MIGDGLARVAAERVARVRTAREADDAVDEFVDVARRAEHRPLVGDGHVGRARSAGRSAGDSTSPICSRSLATIPPPIAMYSKIFVGDPKNLLSTMWLLCGDTIEVARLQQPRALRLRHPADALHPIVEAVALDFRVELRLVGAVADQEKSHARAFRRRCAEWPPPARRSRATSRRCR